MPHLRCSWRALVSFPVLLVRSFPVLLVRDGMAEDRPGREDWGQTGCGDVGGREHHNVHLLKEVKEVSTTCLCKGPHQTSSWFGVVIIIIIMIIINYYYNNKWSNNTNNELLLLLLL